MKKDYFYFFFYFFFCVFVAFLKPFLESVKQLLINKPEKTAISINCHQTINYKLYHFSRWKNDKNKATAKLKNQSQKQVKILILYNKTIIKYFQNRLKNNQKTNGYKSTKRKTGLFIQRMLWHSIFF